MQKQWEYMLIQLMIQAIGGFARRIAIIVIVRNSSTMMAILTAAITLIGVVAVLSQLCQFHFNEIVSSSPKIGL